MDDNFACPFLNEEKLCRIHSKLGGENLSLTCTTYPRMYNLVNGILEKSGTMSCAEVLRLALLNPSPMEFDEIETEENIEEIIGSIIDTNSIKVSKLPTKFFWELRVFTIQLLQNRNYKLWERLIIMGLFYQKVEEYSNGYKVNEVPNLINNYNNNIEAGVFHEFLAEIPSNNTLQMVLLRELTDERIINGINNKRYLECFSDFVKGIEFFDQSSKEEIGQRYEEACFKYYDSFMEEHEYILENYLVNYVFKNLFPIVGEKSVFGNYTMLVIHYAMIKMHLIECLDYIKMNLV